MKKIIIIIIIILIFTSLIPIHAEFNKITSSTYYLYRKGFSNIYTYPDENSVTERRYEESKKIIFNYKNFHENNSSYSVETVDNNGITEYYANFSSDTAEDWLMPKVIILIPENANYESRIYMNYFGYNLLSDGIPPLLVDPDFERINKILYNFFDETQLIQNYYDINITMGNIISNVTYFEFMNTNNLEEGREQLLPDTKKWDMAFYQTEWIGDKYQVKYNTSLSLEYQNDGQLKDITIQHSEKINDISVKNIYEYYRYYHLSLDEEKINYFPIVTNYYSENINIINIILLVILIITYKFASKKEY